MKFIVSQIMDMFYLTVEGIKVANNLFVSGLQLSYFIGQSIVVAFVHIVEKVCAFLQLVHSVACIVYEDYCFFVVDLITKVKWLLSGLNFAVNGVITYVQHTVTSLKHLLDSVLYFFYSNLEFLMTIIGKGGSSLYNTLDIIKQALIFTGNSIWYFISIIPVSIVYIITLFLCYISETVLEFYLALCNTCHSILNSVHKLILFFSDVPGEAAIGLIVGVIAFCFMVKHCSLLVQLTTDLILSAIRSCRVIVAVWIFFKDFFSPIFPNIRSRNSDSWDLPRDRSPLRSCDSGACTSRCCEHDRELASKLCIVCQDKEKTVIVLPCRHVCLCVVCCTIIEEQYGRCPVCRQRVERTMMVYI